jgi:hypothetical protein
MTIQCPHCGETKARSEVRQPLDFSFGFLLLAAVGGIIGGLFYMLGQERKFQCGRCDKTFFSPTTVSRIFFTLCIIVYTAVAALIIYAIWDSL